MSWRPVLERVIEARLTRRAKAAGGMAIKWTAPGLAGVPDRIVFLPGGHVFFVETKSPGQKLRPLQAHVINRLRTLGATVHVIDSLEGVDALFA